LAVSARLGSDDGRMQILAFDGDDGRDDEQGEMR
jgi:hypothetical protein